MRNTNTGYSKSTSFIDFVCVFEKIKTSTYVTACTY